MTTELIISIIGAITAIGVSIVGALLANQNSIVLQTKKLKEEHYVAYMEALHQLAGENHNNEATKKYVFARDKLLLIAGEDVVKKMIRYEEEAVGKENDLHDTYLTELIKTIRKDLKIVDRNFPKIYLKKANK
ncbi:hypothetical protein [Flavobacterium chilense]|uniref:Uncharacterized protein n=1 Tax=Flavobacterium chilense TaxID=946677 RepID=A0A1M7IR67_9FLAO|nr:hypothetical protein [Flavobacterium chilense]SHM43179.1 hypothetical protein SAMN05444484_10615 [Flavobacterium chilense]